MRAGATQQRAAGWMQQGIHCRRRQHHQSPAGVMMNGCLMAGARTIDSHVAGAEHSPIESERLVPPQRKHDPDGRGVHAANLH